MAAARPHRPHAAADAPASPRQRGTMGSASTPGPGPGPAEAKAQAPPAAYLQIQSGDGGTTRVVELGAAPVRIGRGIQCEVRLAQVGLGDIQCMIRRRGGDWHFQPIGPPGRIWIDGRPADSQRTLPVGAVLQVGRSVLTIHEADQSSDRAIGSFDAPITVGGDSTAPPSPVSLAPTFEPPPASRFEPPPAPEPIPEPPAAEPAPSSAEAPAADGPGPHSGVASDRARRWQSRLDQRDQWLRDRQSEKRWEARWKAAGESIRARSGHPAEPAPADPAPVTPEPPPPTPPGPASARPIPTRPTVVRPEPRPVFGPARRVVEPAAPSRPEPPQPPAAPVAPAPTSPGPTAPFPATSRPPLGRVARPTPPEPERAPAPARREGHPGWQGSSDPGPRTAPIADPGPTPPEAIRPVAIAELAGSVPVAAPIAPIATGVPTPAPVIAEPIGPDFDDVDEVLAAVLPHVDQTPAPTESSLAPVAEPVRVVAAPAVDDPLPGGGIADRGLETPATPEDPATPAAPGTPRTSVSWMTRPVTPSPSVEAPHPPIEARSAPVRPAPEPTRTPAAAKRPPVAPAPAPARPLTEPSPSRPGSGHPASPAGPAEVPWPTARAIFAAQGTRATGPAEVDADAPAVAGDPVVPTRSRPRRSATPEPTELIRPESWSVPTWMGATVAVPAVLFAGMLAVALAVVWVGDDASGNLAIRLATRAEGGIAPTLDPKNWTRTAWWETTASHLAAWSLALDRAGAADDRSADARLLEAEARTVSPLGARARFMAEPVPGQEADASASIRLGPTRDVVTLAAMGHRLRRLGKREDAARAYAAAFNRAASTPRATLGRPVFRGDEPVNRYALPHSTLLDGVARDMAGAGDWTPEEWRAATPEFGPALLAVASALRPRDPGEADRRLDALLRRGDAPLDPRFDPAEHRAATAEALAELGRWPAALAQYRRAIDDETRDLDRRVWWFNLAEVARRAGDDATRTQAIEAAKGADLGDEVTQRAANAYRFSGDPSTGGSSR